MTAQELAEKKAAEAKGVPIADAIKTLDRVEATTVMGAPSRTPKAQLLDARSVEAKHPDEALRWVNIRDPQKAAGRQAEGYRRLSSEEGGKQIGDELVLMSIPKAVHEQRIQAIKDLGEQRMSAHITEMQNAAEGVARTLRDNYGISVDARRILVNEQER